MSIRRAAWFAAALGFAVAALPSDALAWRGGGGGGGGWHGGGWGGGYRGGWGGGWRGGVVVGPPIGFGFYGFPYLPPPVVYAPPPVYYGAPPVYAPAPGYIPPPVNYNAPQSGAGYAVPQTQGYSAAQPGDTYPSKFNAPTVRDGGLKK
jgi:hypothetical protein